MPTLSCPRCKVSMKVVLRDAVEVDHCETCDGVWVEHIEEKQMLEIKPSAFTLDEIRRLRKVYEPFGKREKVTYLPCPVCEGLMTRRNWGSHSGVVVDKCEAHGAWYDAGEIEKIREFVALGGVEFEKMRAPQKEATRLESRLIEEVSRVDRKVDSAYRRARMWSWLGF